MGAVTNKKFSSKGWEGVGGGHGGEGSFPRKSNELLRIILTIAMYIKANGVQTEL